MKRTPKWKTVQRWKTSGQALILIILTFFGLLFFLGLMIDLGQIFLAKGYLRRAADSASLAAAAQFRENRTITDMTNAADEVARMNGVAPSSITVDTCASMGYSDAVLCPKPGDMPKKLVRVTIVMDYPMTFLVLLNIYTVQLVETSVSEAASLDVVLVIDTSESMAWDGADPVNPGDPSPKDPSYCNNTTPSSCEPFEHVRAAAIDFTKQILDPTLTPAQAAAQEEDRVSIVTISNGWQGPPSGTYVAQNWTNYYGDAETTINNLKVYDPGIGWNENDPMPDPLQFGLYRMYTPPPDNTYQSMYCLHADYPDSVSAANGGFNSACGTTNIGGALLLAGNQFAIQKRPQSLWVVVLLTDGAANTTFGTMSNLNGGSDMTIVLPGPGGLDTSLLTNHLPLGFCPSDDWVGVGNRVMCQDGTAGNRHLFTNAEYDANDFAMDNGDYVACAPVNPVAGCATKGQGAIIFTIGLGKAIVDTKDTTGTKPYGGVLLRYLAAVGDDGDPSTDLCAVPSTATDWTKSCGNYFYAQGGAGLEPIFQKIYSRIFTRLTQ
jgi:Flp pilus assembly protein TadG